VIGLGATACQIDARVGPSVICEASLTGISFYEGHGYSPTGKVLNASAGPQVEAEKIIGENRLSGSGEQVSCRRITLE
jgi:hypothetical protein